MSDVAYKRGDTVPIEARLPADLTGYSSVMFEMFDGDKAVISDTAIVVDTVDGVVAYQWQPSETDRTGLYTIEWQVTWGDGGVETFPKDGRDSIYFYE